MGYLQYKLPAISRNFQYVSWGIGIFLIIIVSIFGLTLTKRTNGICPHCNVILISIDSIAARDIDCEKNAARTPNICAFARQSLEFPHAYAQDTWTLPNLFSLMTSQYASTHHMVNRQSTLSAEIVTLPQIFQQNGYETVFVGPTDNPHVPLSKGFGRGFSVIIPDSDNTDWSIDLSKLSASSRKKPFFMLFNSFYTHGTWEDSPIFASYQHFSTGIWNQIIADYDMGADADTPIHMMTEDQRQIFTRIRFATRYDEAERLFNQAQESARAFYYAAEFMNNATGFSKNQMADLRALNLKKVESLDASMAIFFDHLRQSGLLNNSIVILTGTHGDEFGEHGDFSHATRSLFNEVINVPLLIYIPKVPHRTIDALVQSIDLFPTVLALTGLQQPPKLAGLNLEPYIRKIPGAKTNSFVVSEHGEASQFRAIRNAEWNLLISDDDASAQLYDLRKDPGEQTDVAAINQPEVRFLHAQLNHIIQNQPLFH